MSLESSHNPALLGAGGALTSAALFLASIFFAPVGYILCLASPMPVALAVFRGGQRAGFIATVFATLIVAGAVSPSGGLGYLTQFGIGGWLLGSGFRRGWPVELLVGGFGLASAVGFGLSLLYASAGSGISPGEYLDRSVAEFVALATPETTAESDPSLAMDLERFTEELVRFFAVSFAGLFGAFSLLAGWANCLAIKKILTSKGVAVPAWSTWAAPEWAIWVLITSGLATQLGSDFLATAGWTVFIPSLAIYFLQGMAIVAYVMEARNFPPLFRAAIYIMIFFSFPVMAIVICGGAFDMWVDLRTRLSPKKPESHKE